MDEIVTVAVEAEEFENDVYQAALEAVIAERKPDVVLLGFTVNSMDFAPAVATKLGLGLSPPMSSPSARKAAPWSRRGRTTAPR